MRQLNYEEITLDKEKSSPLYLQLADELRRQIGSVSLNSSERLISERKLSERLGVDRTTVNKAYCELLKEGLLTQRSARTLCISAEARRKNVTPFPNIGIILPQQFSSLIERNNGQTLQYMKGIIDSAAARHISTIMIQLPDVDATGAQIDQFNNELAERLIGVIHIGGRNFHLDRPLERLMKFDRLPQVMISAFPPFSNVGTITANPLSGGYALAEQMFSLGHRSVGFVSYTESIDGGRTDSFLVYEAYSRPRKLLRVFQKYGLDCDERYHCFRCNGYSSILRKLKSKLKEKNMPTVYWCINDELVYWVIKALEELGIRVPEDISVVGYDGVSSAADEKLTTICLPFYAIGYRSLNLLLDYYENGKNEQNSHVEIATSLVIRRTLSRVKKYEYGKDGK